VVDVERRIVQGSAAQVERLRCRSQGDGVINTAYIERLNATFRERLSSLTRRGRALARQAHTLRPGMYLIGTVYHFCTPHESLRVARAAASGGRLDTRPRWPLGSPIMAGVFRTCCRFKFRRIAGDRPSGVSVLHGLCNAWLSGGAHDHG